LPPGDLKVGPVGQKEKKRNLEEHKRFSRPEISVLKRSSFDDIDTSSFNSAKESIEASPSKKAVEEERCKYELAMEEARLEGEGNARRAELEDKEKARCITAAEEETRRLLEESGSIASRTKEQHEKNKSKEPTSKNPKRSDSNKKKFKRLSKAITYKTETV
jgi:hypothetical protein